MVKSCLQWQKEAVVRRLLHTFHLSTVLIWIHRLRWMSVFTPLLHTTSYWSAMMRLISVHHQYNVIKRLHPPPLSANSFPYHIHTLNLPSGRIWGHLKWTFALYILVFFTPPQHCPSLIFCMIHFLHFDRQYSFFQVPLFPPTLESLNGHISCWMISNCVRKQREHSKTLS